MKEDNFIAEIDLFLNHRIPCHLEETVGLKNSFPEIFCNRLISYIKAIGYIRTTKHLNNNRCCEFDDEIDTFFWSSSSYISWPKELDEALLEVIDKNYTTIVYHPKLIERVLLWKAINYVKDLNDGEGVEGGELEHISGDDCKRENENYIWLDGCGYKKFMIKLKRKLREISDIKMKIDIGVDINIKINDIEPKCFKNPKTYVYSIPRISKHSDTKMITEQIPKSFPNYAVVIELIKLSRLREEEFNERYINGKIKDKIRLRSVIEDVLKLNVIEMNPKELIESTLTIIERWETSDSFNLLKDYFEFD
ncbi:uncharacterized protein ASCRUDRAFT_138764 [Ascoidea rubescens DSM 1968]|uniref:Uncharacterized protein n=1 Tax=Ascoidea rubescens DSM 1968 TaxID=1344418 RepID=A0A1D2VK29_9ASCO|nr:hypothetical protein ASCRUDRAFT_138764 [Ascoidea rubescens DSM 1968]ODV61877.1 hypothetical protein ASCRUDRAFT_138764 [Ascoidea rubescens DSM 1968]